MKEEGKDGAQRSSDAPMDLSRERETFVRSFLRKGVELTEELLAENVTLREQLAQREAEAAALRAQIASDDAIRDLLTKIEKLEREKVNLFQQSESLAQARRNDRDRFSEIEQELNDLANLYIAAYQLHSSLSLRRVVRHLQDMVGQLVGAHSFVIYVVDGQAGEARPLASEHVAAEEVRSVPLGEGPVGETCLTGIARIPDVFPEPLPAKGTVSEPFALIPLLACDKPVGVVAIVSMLEQKTKWAKVDHELFNLLGAHAGPALIAANLFSASQSSVSALDGLIENLARRRASSESEGPAAMLGRAGGEIEP